MFWLNFLLFLIRGYGSVRKMPAKKFGGGNRCVRCNLAVYEMERVVALKSPFHKLCYSCFECRKTLSPINCCESSEGEIYCKCKWILEGRIIIFKLFLKRFFCMLFLACFTKGSGLDRTL